MTQRRRWPASGALVLILAGSGVAYASPSPAPAIPAENPGLWITTPDYPAISARLDQEGTSRFELRIGPDGKATGCTITTSSGYPLLDEATCARLVERARFQPARDARGKPTIGTYAGSVRWRLPRIAPPPGRITYAMTVGTDGVPTNCEVVAIEGFDNEPVKPGLVPCPTAMFFTPFFDVAGKTVAKRVTMITEISTQTLP